MSDDKDKEQQTEEPTQKRLEQAREQGDAIKSTEVATFVLLGGGALAIAMFGQYTVVGLAKALKMFLEQPEAMSVDGAGLASLTRGLFAQLAITLAPILGMMMLAALAGHLVQGTPTFSASKIAPDISKISPMAGFKRLFGLDGWVNLLKGLAKMAVVGHRDVDAALARAQSHGIHAQPDGGADGGRDVPSAVQGSAGGAVGAWLIAGLDYFFQRIQFMKRNRMSKQEIKEEYKQNEGDPHIKGKIRQLRQERSRKRMMAQVPTATVVIMNPTHYAVALKYESGKMAAPICVAKGLDALALRIRAVAEDNGVAVVENPPLARALHAVVEIDEPVPPEHFKAVAQVIGYVMRLQGKLPARSA
jgi:flagellar biosynthetic protein FlhB